MARHGTRRAKRLAQKCHIRIPDCGRLTIQQRGVAGNQRGHAKQQPEKLAPEKRHERVGDME